MKLATSALCLFAAIVGCPVAAQAQSAGKVIERYIEAIGGRKTIERIVSTDVSGTVRSPDGRSGVFVQRTSRPNRYFVSMSWGDTHARAGFNGRSAWQEDDVEGRGSSLRIERTLVNGEVWLPSRADLAVRWSFFFGARSQWLTTIECTDHKKFSVATDSTVVLPDGPPDRDQPAR